jgi:hypothetical protein
LVKHIDAAEVPIAFASVIAAAADAVLDAPPKKLCSNLVTALPRLHVRYLARKSSLEAGGALGRKRAGGRAGGVKLEAE